MNNKNIENYINSVKKEVKDKKTKSILYKGKNHKINFGVWGPICTQYGVFESVSAEVVGGKWGKHYILVYPNLNKLLKQKNVLLKFDSGCFSGMVLGDKTCDCKEQMDMSQKICVKNGSGLIIEIPDQDGRGYGHELKMANQKIMYNTGLSTADTAVSFYGSEDKMDIRDYDEAVLILKALGFNSKHKFVLKTNNPVKTRALTEAGLNISKVESLIVNNLNKLAKRNVKSKLDLWKNK